MKHRALGGLTAAVLLSAFGVPFTSNAQGAGTGPALQPIVTEPFSEFSAIANAGPASDSAATSPEQTAPATGALEPALHQDSDLTTVHAHVLDDRQAATLFVNSIPVLTLIGADLSTTGDSKELDASAPIAPGQDPVVRANGIAQQLVNLAADADASDINARWDEDQELFVVAWGDSDLVAFDQQTMLADSTEDPAEDALQAANRLRRLLGEAPPLTEIGGMP
jgi:rare lipoprotein A